MTRKVIDEPRDLPAREAGDVVVDRMERTQSWPEGWPSRIRHSSRPRREDVFIVRASRPDDVVRHRSLRL